MPPADRPAARLRRQLIIERAIGIPLMILLVYWVFALKAQSGRACFIVIETPDVPIRLAVSDEESAEQALDRVRGANAGAIPRDAIRLRPEPILRLGPLGKETLQTVDGAVGALQGAIDSGQLEVLSDAVVVFVDGQPTVAVRTEQDVEILEGWLKTEYTDDIPPEKLIGEPEILEQIDAKPETRRPGAIVTGRAEAVERLLRSDEDDVEVWVGPGESLGTYLARYGVSRERLEELNPDVDLDNLEIGQHLCVWRGSSRVTVHYKVAETVTEELDYPVEETPSSSLRPGERKVEQAGRKGLARTDYIITFHNDREISREVGDRLVLEEPQPEKALVGPAE